MPSPLHPADDRRDTAFFGHPRGLSTLFFTEMWERFSYYGMRAFLIFYMVTPTAQGGLGYSDASGGIVVGTYLSLVYLASVPGGWIADRYLGLRRSVLYGGVLIMAGHAVLALPVEAGFFIGLALVVLGTGLLKANVSALVGQLYGPDDPRRDAGFSIYYMGINLGAFFAPLLCGYLAQDSGFRGFLAEDVGVDPNVAWHVAFGMAAIGMLFGVIQFYLGQRHLAHVGEPPPPPRDAAEASKRRTTLTLILLAVFGVPAAIVLLVQVGVLTSREEVGNLFGMILLVVSVGIFGGLYGAGAQSTDERRRVIVMLVLFLASTVFWGCFEQASNVLNLFAQKYTAREILGFDFPASWLQSANAIFVIVFAPVFAVLWAVLARRRQEPTSPAKFGAALVLVGLGFGVMVPAAILIDAGTADGRDVLVGPGFLLGLYLLHTWAELCLSPVGLSSMSKLAPARWGGLVMGVWFLSIANGNFLAGKAVGYSASMSPTAFFSMMVAIPVAVGVVLFALVRPINRMLARNTAVEQTFS